MAKGITLSLDETQAALVYEALSRFAVWSSSAAVRVSGMRAPCYYGQTNRINQVQRQLAVKMEVAKKKR